MNNMQRIRLGLLCAKLKLENIHTQDKTYPKDPNPENWRTISGAKVHLENGKINGGAGGKGSPPRARGIQTICSNCIVS